MLPKYAMGIKIQVCRMQLLAGRSSETEILGTHSYNKANKYNELDTVQHYGSVIFVAEASELVR